MAFLNALPTTAKHTSHSRWRAHQGSGFLHLRWECSWPTGGHGQRCHSQDWQGQSSFCHVQEHLVVQGDQDKNQTSHLQLQCEVSLALRMRNLEDDKDNATENPDILQHLSAAHLQHQLARDDPKWRAVGASGTGTSSKTNSEEEVGLDRTHPQEASIQHHTPSSDLEPAGKEEERPASQQLEARHWGRAQAARYKLDRSSKISPEQSAMARGRRWPMLHTEPRALVVVVFLNAWKIPYLWLCTWYLSSRCIPHVTIYHLCSSSSRFFHPVHSYTTW